VRLAEVRYRTGLVNYLDVLDAQQTALAAETQLVLTERTRLTDMLGLFKALGGGWMPSPTRNPACFSPYPSCRKRGFSRHGLCPALCCQYGNPLCQDSRTSSHDPLPRPSWWSMTNRPSRGCARQSFSRRAFRSSMPMAVRRPSRSAPSTKSPSISCSQTSSCPLRAFKWPQAPINSPMSTAMNLPSARSACGKTCE